MYYRDLAHEPTTSTGAASLKPDCESRSRNIFMLISADKGAGSERGSNPYPNTKSQ